MFKVVLWLHNEFKTGRGSLRLCLEKKMKERHTLNELKKKIYLFYFSQKIHVTAKTYQK